jgi:hypothetical protein
MVEDFEAAELQFVKSLRRLQRARLELVAAKDAVREARVRRDAALERLGWPAPPANESPTPSENTSEAGNERR